MRGNYSSKAYYNRDRSLKAEAPASPVMLMPMPTQSRANAKTTTPKPRYKSLARVIVMRKREERQDGVEVWGPEAA
jgi:hypothetical protein